MNWNLILNSNYFLFLLLAITLVGVGLCCVLWTQALEQFIDCHDSLFTFFNSEFEEALLEHLLDLFLEVKHLLKDLIGLLFHFLDEFVLLIQEFVFADLDPLVEAARPIPDIKELLVIIIFKHNLH